MKKRLIASVLGLLTVSACAPATDPVSVATVQPLKPIVPAVDALQLKHMTWVVITPDNYDQVVTQLRGQDSGILLYAITSEGYAAYVSNNIDVMKLIRQQQQIIAVYENW